jgi:membrane-associated HD superfamily phosphohydrolase
LMLSGLMEGSSINGWFAYIINLLVVLGVIAWAVYSVYNDYNSEKKANIMLMAFPAVFTLSLLIAKFAESGTIGAWLFNLYGIALGADYIMKGIKSKDYQILALGIIIALPILYYKIEDLLKEVLAGDNGQVVGGLILCAVSAGLLYIGINFYNSTRTNEE